MYCNKNSFFNLMPVILLSAVLTGFLCGPLEAGNNIQVFVSILPQKYFVQQIGTNSVDVQVMVPPGASPATYEPRPSQMKALVNTDIYFAIGVPFEKVWLNKIAAINPRLKIIHTDEGIQKQFLADHIHEGATGHAVDRHGHNDSSGHIPDPHIWLSPPLVMIQARAILLGLEQADPDRRAIYAQNYRNFIAKLVDIDEALRQLFDQTVNKRFMVLHPAWGYFAHAYGLVQVPIEIEGKNPKPAQLKELIDYARQHGLSTVLAQPQSSSKFAEQLAKAIKGKVTYADPLSSDWDRNLVQVAEKIKNTLK